MVLISVLSVLLNCPGLEAVKQVRILPPPCFTDEITFQNAILFSDYGWVESCSLSKCSWTNCRQTADTTLFLECSVMDNVIRIKQNLWTIYIDCIIVADESKWNAHSQWEKWCGVQNITYITMVYHNLHLSDHFLIQFSLHPYTSHSPAALVIFCHNLFTGFCNTALAAGPLHPQHRSSHGQALQYAFTLSEQSLPDIL